MTRAILTALFTATFIGSSFVTPFSGFTADQLPIPQVQPPIQPAGYAFAIWGLIYAWLILSALFGLWKRSTDPAWDVMRAPLVISLVIGTPWLWVATQTAIGATVLIFAMAITAIIATLRAPTADRWIAQAPVALYAGWLTAASFVSLGSTMAGYGIAMDQIGWAYTGIGLALLVALGVQSRIPRMPTYGLVVIWALVGIIVANGFTGVGIMALAGIGVMGVMLGTQVRHWAGPCLN